MPQPGRPSRGRLGGPGSPPWQRWVLPLLAALAIGLVVASLFGGGERERLSYHPEFLERVEAGEVESVTIGPEGRIKGELDNGEAFTTVVPTALDTGELEQKLVREGVEIRAEAPANGLTEILLSFAPFLLLLALLWWFARRTRGQVSQMTGIGQSRAKVIDEERPDTTFDDVAGYHSAKEEILEIVDYLKDPSSYREMGARGPGGVLLVGPPGTGKTLMARAVAGEADVPFISASGSEFVEMLVGVGASRVRDLFEKARKLAPSIIFIDELDSVGRKRGSAQTIGSHNEQEQTLNQLLAEMDGFDPAEGIVVMAATNRPEMLDNALLRPGRFDRQITVGLPKLADRREILEVHVDGKPLADDVDLDVVARGSPGFSGAELENLTNEAAINAVRHKRREVLQEDFDFARDRMMLGRREDSNVLRPEELRRVAVHESGHALIAALTDDADPVEKVTVLPIGRALGVTHQLPLDERRLHAESYMRGTLDVRLGGRAAELLVLGEASTGAAHDLAGATKLATRMVRDFGLSPEIGPVGYASENGVGGDNGSVPEHLRTRPFAEETQRLIDKEVARLLREAEDRAGRLLREHRHAVDALVERLLEKETVDGTFVYELVGRDVPRHEPGQGAGQGAGQPDDGAGRAATADVPPPDPR